MNALFSEIFPVRAGALEHLYAYQPVYRGEAGRIGGKLAYRLRRALGGYWTWLDGRLITDTQPNPVKLLMALDEVKSAAPKLFSPLELLEEDVRWRPTPETIAEFIIRGPIEVLEPTIQQALEKVNFPVRNVRVERECKARSWVINGTPSVSLSILTRLIYHQPIAEYAAALQKPSEMVGLHVADRTSTLQGRIIKIVGELKGQRERLIGLSQRQAMRDILQAAPDETLVLRVESKGEQYDYAANALMLLVTLDTARRFDVVPDQVERATQINPSLRAQLVKIAADIIKEAGLLDNAFSQQNAPDHFIHIDAMPEVAWGGGKARTFDISTNGMEFTKNGAFRPLTSSLRLAAINALGDDGELYLEALERELLRTHKTRLTLVKTRKLTVVSEQNIDSGVRAIAKEDADVLIALFPDDPDSGDELPPSDRYLKMQAVARGIPSLIVHQSSMNKLEATPTLLMGLVGRAGAAPFAFEEPLPYADGIAGLNLLRIPKKDGVHLHALLRLYSNRGVCLGWRSASEMIKTGDGIPESVLTHLLPAAEIAMKRTLLHVYDTLHQVDAEALSKWEELHDGVLYPVAISPRGSPRLYNFVGKKIEMPPRGSAFIISEREALLVSGGAPPNATPQPLHIRSHAPLKLSQVMDSVMTMSLLHHGALKIPKLPVTLSMSDEWADGVERGLFPTVSSGKNLWWL